jgi:ABC-type multidrug transport system fused ATPase/permease subunit
MGRSYRDFIRGNSASLSKSIISEAQNLSRIFYSALFMMSEIFVIIFIYTIMIYTNWKITLLFSLILFINILFLLKTISPKIKNEGRNREKFQRKFYEILNSTFGNFKMIKLESKDDIVLKKFKEASSGFTLSNIRKETLSYVPRLFLEALGFVIVIMIILYYVYQNQRDASTAMAMISMFIVGLYRLMPSANRILSSYNNIIFNYRSLNIVHNDLIYKIENLGDDEVKFERSIRLKDVSFAYIEGKNILSGVSLVINKGEKTAFFGESGSGKSTLADIIMGLYRLKEGEVFVDDVLLDETNIKNFRKKIGYIPQSIYLFDGTVAQNVAFDSKINDEKIRKVLEQANILEFLENDHEGINTKVGENGLNLSGGQKQRIAIARALYNDPDILVLDEATSALDNETEMKIMNEIYSSSDDKTLIIISHRLSTLNRCDKIYRLENGIIKL